MAITLKDINLGVGGRAGESNGRKMGTTVVEQQQQKFLRHQSNLNQV